MARYGTSVVSQTQQLAGMPVTTTVNGYIGSWTASATAGFKLRRVKVGVRTTSASVPTSQQLTLELHRQTVLPVGTVTVVAGEAFELHTPVDPTAGFLVATSTTFATSGPTLNTQPIATLSFNTQSMVDAPFEFLEEIFVNKGTANGIAIVNIGNTLPATHLLTVDFEIEV